MTGEILYCANCGAKLHAGALACSECPWLIHSTDAEALARGAREKEAAGDYAGAAASLREALALLPPQSGPAISIRQRLGALVSRTRGESEPTLERTPGDVNSDQLPLGAPQPPPGPAANANPQENATPSGQARINWKKRLGPFGVILAFLAKFKTAILLAITKGKFLIFGLAKLKTVLSMFAFWGVYWALYGWKFAAGFVFGIYVHEMGHVWALRRFGLRASAPMFIPGFGAFVSLYDSPADVNQDARIGLAGPIWGAAAALAFLAPGLLTGDRMWLAVAHATAYINLFNLTPVWQLDGGRGFRALNINERIMLLVLAGALWWIIGSGMFIIVMLGAAYRCFIQRDYNPAGDRGVLAQFASLLLLFGLMFRIAG